MNYDSYTPSSPRSSASKRRNQSNCYVWGWGGQGQLGIGDIQSKVSPVNVSSLSKNPTGLTQLVCGSRFTAVVTKGGGLYTFGKGDDGQLGHGNKLQQSTPRLVEALSLVSVVSVAARGAHVLALDSNGKCWSWGRGDEGQLGHGTTESQSAPRPIMFRYDNKEVIVSQIACGRQHSTALSVTGDLFTWGSGDDGALGHGDNLSSRTPSMVTYFEGIPIAQVLCGSRHVMAIPQVQINSMREDNDRVVLYAWGWGAYGQLGTGERVSMSSPNPIRESVFQSQKNQRPSSRNSSPLRTSQQLGDLSSLSVVSVTCGYRHTLLALKLVVADAFNSPNSDLPLYTNPAEAVWIWAWGWNQFGQCGVNPDHSGCVTTPTRVFFLTDSHRTLKKSHSGVNYGSLLRASPRKRSTDSPVYETELSPGSFILSKNRTPSIDEEGGGNVSDSSLGLEERGSSLSSGGRVLHQPTKGFRSVYAMGAGGRHSVISAATWEDGAAVVCSWGRGDDGQLGTGGLASSAIPVEVSTLTGYPLDTIGCGWAHTGILIQGQGPSRAQLGGGISDGEESESDYSSDDSWGSDEGTESGTESETGDSGGILRRAHRKHHHHNDIGHVVTRQLKRVARKTQKITKWLRLVPGDWDGCVGQVLGALIQFMIATQICSVKAGMPQEEVVGVIIPACGLSIFFGSLAYFFQARHLCKVEGRRDVTAQPQGISAIIFFAYVLMIMTPEYQQTGDFRVAWATCLFAASLTAILELLCIPLVFALKAFIPKAALRSSVAGVAFPAITMGFAFEVFSEPVVALPPLMVIFIAYGSNTALPFRIPGALGALVLGGCLLAVQILLSMLNTGNLHSLKDERSVAVPTSFHLPSLQLELLYEGWASGRGWGFMSVIIPVTMVNISANLAQLESAAMAGDRFDVGWSMALDAVATLVGVFFGSPFPTCIFIGQPAFKAMGARSAYMMLTGVFVFVIAITGATSLIFSFVPMSAGVGFLLWVGILITAQAFEQDSSSPNHGWAVALGLIPCLASWALQLVQATMLACQSIMEKEVPELNSLAFHKVFIALDEAGTHPFGMIALSQGYLLTSIILASTMVHIVDRRFEKAAVWMLIGSALSWIGMIHGYELRAGDIASVIGPPQKHRWGADFASVYLFSALIMMAFHVRDGGDSGYIEVKDSIAFSLTKFWKFCTLANHQEDEQYGYVDDQSDRSSTAVRTPRASVTPPIPPPRVLTPTKFAPSIASKYELVPSRGRDSPAKIAEDSLSF